MARQSIVSIARPYTHAIFRLASQEQTKGHWTHDLALLRDLVGHPKIKALIGGAVIRLGDQVIDNSLRNRLNRLSSSLRLA